MTRYVGSRASPTPCLFGSVLMNADCADSGCTETIGLVSVQSSLSIPPREGCQITHGVGRDMPQGIEVQCNEE